MTTLHHIGELLQSGVRPTDEETEHLRSLGGFVAEMFGRYLAGGKETLSSGPDGWSSRLAGRLSAANGARWEQGLGLGEMFLANDLTSFWQVSKGGLAEGYGGFEADRSLLELYEEEVAPQPENVVEAAPRRRRPSLFGAKGTQVAQARAGRPRATQAPAAAGRSAQGDKSGAALRAARWADGGTAEMTVVKALASGGLFVGDQVSQLIAESGEIFTRGGGSAPAARRASNTSATPGAGESRVVEAQGRTSAMTTAGAPAVSLDGLRIDGRTPALASAIARAEAVFGRGDQMIKPAVAASRMSQLGAIVPFSMEGVDRGYGLGERPVYGFYDAAETTYVNLASEATAPVDQGVDASTPTRAGRAVARRQTMSPSARSQRQLAERQAAQRGVAARGVDASNPAGVASDAIRSATGGGARAELRASANSQSSIAARSSQGYSGSSQVTKLDSLVRPANAAPGTVPLRPWTSGASTATGRDFGGFGAPVASEVVHAPNGVATPRVQRGSGFAPRISLTQIDALASLGGVSAASLSPEEGGGIASVPALRGERNTSALGTGVSAARGTAPGADGGPARAGAMAAVVAQMTAPRTLPMSASTSGVGAPSWHLAADAGPDLPLGAGFTGPEVFSALVRSQRADDVRQAGAGFRPTVAAEYRSSEQFAGTSSPRAAQLSGGVGASRLADLVDGLVWVSLPDEGQALAGQTAGDSLEGMGLAAVPTGRRSAMVPAGMALGAISARSTSHAAAAARANIMLEGSAARFGAGLESPAREAGVLGVSSETGSASAGPLLGSAVQGRATAGMLGGGVDSAALTASDVALRASLVAGRIEKATGMAALSSGLVPQVTRSAGGIASQGVIAGSPTADARMAFPTTLEGGLDLGATSGGASAPIGLRSSSGGFRGSAGWNGGAPGMISERLAQTIEGAVNSGYGRLDTERVMLASSSVEAQPVAAGTAEGEQAIGRGRGMSRRLAGRIGRDGAGRGTGARANEMASGTQGPVSPEQRAAFAARQALLRPVPTAREARAVANVFSGQGALGRQLGLSSGQPMTWAGAAAGSDEPVLGRIVAARAESGGQLAAAASRWESSPELMARLASLEPGAKKELGQTLRLAGWKEAEIQMLRLEGTGPTAMSAGAELAVGEQAQLSKSRLDASRMGRSFARVVAGAEALGGPVAATSTVGASAATGIAGKSASSPMPMLEGRVGGQDYFGALASSGPVVGYGSLRDELGELVKMAQVVSSQANDPAALEAQQGLVARARSVLARSSGAERGAASKLLARLEAVSTRAQTAGRADQAGLLGAIAKSMGRDSAGSGLEVVASSDAGIGQSASGFTTRTEAPIGSAAEGFEAQLARIEGSVDATTMGFGKVGGAVRAMDFDDVEMAVLALEREVAPGLEARLAQALALSTAGPAGVRRLLGGGAAGRGKAGETVGPRGMGAARSAPAERTGVESSESAPQAGYRGVLQSLLSSLGGGAVGQRQLAALAEELGGNLPVSLNKVIAPEAMLQGLRSPELSAAMKTIRARQQVLGAEMTRVLATLADSGVDLAAARSSLSAVAREYGLTTDIERFAAVPTAEGGEGLRGYEATSTTSELAGASPEQAFLQLVSESVEGGGAMAGSRSLAQVAAMVRRGGLSRTQRAGLLSSLLRGTERAERTSLLEEAGGSEFAFAWLSRVDGSKTGLDIGLGETREEFGKAFGGRRDSAVSVDSPIGRASLVSPVSDAGAARVGGTGAGGPGGARGAGGRATVGGDKSGLRSLASTVTHTTTGAARPQHGASQAVRRTDWSFVDTGSRASTTHADLGRLASAIVSSSESGQRAPMPLVAPAVKAVAQTALRDSKTSSAPSQPAGGSGGAPADAGKRGPVDAKMSEKAIEMLAVEMANRVARLMGLMKERIGVWS